MTKVAGVFGCQQQKGNTTMKSAKNFGRSALPMLAAVAVGLALGAPTAALADGGHMQNHRGKRAAEAYSYKSCAVAKVTASKGTPNIYYAVKAPRMAVPEVGYVFGDGVYRTWVPAIGNSVEGPRIAGSDEICVGDEIRTDALSQINLKFNDGSMVVVGPRSSLKIDEYVTAAHTGADTDLHTVSAKLTLNNGELRTVVPSMRPGSNWIIATPQSTARVAGYNWNATAADWMTQVLGGTTDVFVNSGDVVVNGKGGGVAAVGKGYGTTVSEWAVINHWGDQTPTVPVVGGWSAAKIAYLSSLVPMN
ncbi:exported hypothetical protein [uncultured Gammaproteobacteria bacterium]